MSHPKIEAFINTSAGTALNPDNAVGLQCVDAADALSLALFGNWIKALGAVGGARELFDSASAEYWTKVRNNLNDTNQVPPRGSLIIWDSTWGGGYGHVAISTDSTPEGPGVLQQDGSAYDPSRPLVNGYAANVPMHFARYKGYDGVIGWLVPREDKILGSAARPIAFRRVKVHPSGANLRNGTISRARVVSTATGGTVLEVEAFKRAPESMEVAGSRTWFKIHGRPLWVHESALIAAVTDGLKEIK